MQSRLPDVIVRHPWIVLVLTLFCIGLAARGIRQLEFTADYRVFFSKENPQLAAFETLQNTYTKNDNILIALAPKDGQVFTAKTLGAVADLTERAWQTPYSLRVDSITNFQNTRGVGDDLIVENLVDDPAALTPADLTRVRSIALAEPLLVHRLIAASGDVTAVNVTVNMPGKDQRLETPEVVDFARQLVKEVRAEHPDIEVYLTGTVMMNNAFQEASKNDMRTLVPIMFLVIVLALAFLLRQYAGVLATVFIILGSILATMGLVGWAGLKITPPSSAAPTVILTLAVADSVHILLSYLFYAHHGKNKQDAMAEALRVNFTPILVTSLTTAIGLLGMNFSDSPPLRDLGNIVAVGVTLAWILAFTLLPALMMLLPHRVSTVKTREHRAMEQIAEFVIRHRRTMFWGNLAVIAVLTACITRNELNDAFVEYFDQSTEFRKATDFVTERLTGIYFIDYSLNSSGPEDISDPAFLSKVEAFANWFRTQPEVIHVNVITDILKRLNKNLHGDDPAYYRLPEARDLAAQYLLLYEMSLPYGLDLNNQINVDKSATRMSVTLKNLTTRQQLSLEQRARTWLVKNAPDTMQGDGSSPSVMFTHIGQRNMESMVPGNILSLVLVSVILIIAFRSFKFGLISVIPNAVPILMSFGVWGLLVGEVGMALAIVGSMTLGIVVDDTIHYITKYLRARREQGLSPEDAIRYAMSSIGTAMWVLTVVLILGFSVLAFSTFKMNAGMGQLTALTFAIALIADFLFLPSLLLMFEDKLHAKPVTAAIRPQPVRP